MRSVRAPSTDLPPRPPQRNRGGPRGPLNTATKTLRGLARAGGGAGGQGTPPSLHLPAADHRLSREGVRAGGGLRGEGATCPGAEGGWAGAGGPEGGLAVKVCPHRALRRQAPGRVGSPPPWALPLRPPPRFRVPGLPVDVPTYLKTHGQRLHGAFPIGLPGRGSLGSEERTQEARVTGAPGLCLAGGGRIFRLVPHQGLETGIMSRTSGQQVASLRPCQIRNQQSPTTTVISPKTA